MSAIDLLIENLDLYSHGVPYVTILTGAGISAESGLQTFRGDGGLWCGHRVEDVATPQAFQRNPKLVHEFYNLRRSGLLDPDILPNAAHIALGKLQKALPEQITLITQNIDNLHERGGFNNPIHMHGEVLKAFCTHCGIKQTIKTDLDTNHLCPSCQTPGGLRPDIVWFGEMPYHMDKIEHAIANSDLFISIGTSGNVYPAAGFVKLANYEGAQTLEINLEPSINAIEFTQGIYGKASLEVPKFIDMLIERFAKKRKFCNEQCI